MLKWDSHEGWALLLYMTENRRYSENKKGDDI